MTARFYSILSLLFFLAAGSTHAGAGTKVDRSYQWLDRPWIIRYVISIAPRYQSVIEVARRGNAKRERSGDPGFRRYAELFQTTYPLANEPFGNQRVGGYDDNHDLYGELGFQVLEFDRRGGVVTPHSSSQPLTGRQRASGDGSIMVVLSAGDGKPGSIWYWVADWFVGLPRGNSDEFSPALCSSDDDGRYAINSSERYFHPERRFSRYEIEQGVGLFGCREWAFQLYRAASPTIQVAVPSEGVCADGSRPSIYRGSNPALSAYRGKPLCETGLLEGAAATATPYIDVTSYGGKHGEKTRIGTLIGWARVDDPPRPVIGKHGRHWVCLHECPDGERPGLIPDIRNWAEKRGWPLPKPTPTFPDSKVNGM